MKIINKKDKTNCQKQIEYAEDKVKRLREDLFFEGQN